MAQVVGFSATQVDQLVIDMERSWPEARSNEFNTNILQTEALEGVWREQTAELQGKLTENDGCTPIKGIWMESGGAEVKRGQSTDHTSVPCVIDGTQPASNKFELQIVDYLESTLKIPIKDCGNRFSADQKFKRKLQATQIELANNLAAIVPEFLTENAGKSVTAGEFGQYAQVNGSDDKTLIKVPGGNYNPFDIVPYLRELQRFNKFRNPALFDGGSLYYVRQNAAKKQGTPAGDEGQQNEFSGLRIYEDQLGFTDAGVHDYSFLVDKGTVAMYTAAFGPAYDDINDGNGFAEKQFRLPLLGLSFPDGPDRRVQVEHDTIYRRERLPTLADPERCEDFYVWYLRIWYIILKNPLMSGDTTGVNGILRIQRDNSLTQKASPMQKPSYLA